MVPMYKKGGKASKKKSSFMEESKEITFGNKPKPTQYKDGGKKERLLKRSEKVMGRAQKNWKKAEDTMEYDRTANPETSNAKGYADKKYNQAARQEERAERIKAKADTMKKSGGLYSAAEKSDNVSRLKKMHGMEGNTKKYQTAGAAEEEEVKPETKTATTTETPAKKDDFYELANKVAASSPRNAKKALRQAKRVEIARATGTRVGSKAGETLAGAGAALSGAASVVNSVKPGQNRNGGKRKSSGKSMEPGGGGRFAAMVGKLKKEGKSEDSAKAIAASIGRNKYGKSRFQEMAAKGKKGMGGMSDSTSANDAGMEMMEMTEMNKPKKRKKVDASGAARKRGNAARKNQRRGRTGCWSGECVGPEMI